MSLIPLTERFVSGRGGNSAGEASAWAAGQWPFGADGELFFCCTQFCFTATRAC